MDGRIKLESLDSGAPHIPPGHRSKFLVARFFVFMGIKQSLFVCGYVCLCVCVCVYVCVCVDGWTDVRKDGRTEGRADGRTDGRTDGQMGALSIGRGCVIAPETPIFTVFFY